MVDSSSRPFLIGTMRWARSCNHGLVIKYLNKRQMFYFVCRKNEWILRETTLEAAEWEGEGEKGRGKVLTDAKLDRPPIGSFSLINHPDSVFKDLPTNSSITHRHH